MTAKSKYDFDFTGFLVLVVEDNTISFKLIEAMLSRVNLALLHASDGQMAINLCRERADIDIVLMDIQLPILNGIEATRIIREFQAELPILATTANAFADDQAACMAAGCTGYVTKPIDFSKLFTLIESILK